jgi:hypothetical protein
MLWIRGLFTKAAEIGDTYTGKDYQRMGMFSILTNASRKWGTQQGIDIIYGTPNEQSLPGYEKYANFFQIKNVGLVSLILPLNISSILHSKIGIRLSIFFGYVNYYLFRSYFTFSTAYFRSKNSTLIVTQLTCSPIEIEDDLNFFWNKVRAKFNFVLDRSAISIQWRFHDNPNPYKIFILREKGCMIGYIVTRCIHNGQQRTLVIADFLTLPGMEEKLIVLLKEIIRTEVDSSIFSISVWCTKSSDFFRIFKKAGFISRSNIPVIFFKNKIFDSLVEIKNGWHFTMSDTDNI